MELCDQLRELPEESEAIQAEPLSIVGSVVEAEGADNRRAILLGEVIILGSEGASVEATPSTKAPPYVIE